VHYKSPNDDDDDDDDDNILWVAADEINDI